MIEPVEISPTLSQEIGRRIMARRKQLGYTQAQAAEKAGLSHQFFASVETGKKNIRAENIVRLSLALDVSTDYLLTGRSNDYDRNLIASYLKELDAYEQTCAEEILKSYVKACAHKPTKNNTSAK